MNTDPETKRTDDFPQESPAPGLDPNTPNREERAESFSRRAFLAAGWSTPVVLSLTLSKADLAFAQSPVHSDHSDTHADTEHGDIHTDAAHADTYTDTTHEDAHTDVPHQDDLYQDSAYEDYTDYTDYVEYSDNFHVDQPYADTYGEYSDQPHTDEPHGDSQHTDSHTDQAHADTHTDQAHEDSHTDAQEA